MTSSSRKKKQIKLSIIYIAFTFYRNYRKLYDVDIFLRGVLNPYALCTHDIINSCISHKYKHNPFQYVP